jgi:hypothetical protein
MANLLVSVLQDLEAACPDITRVSEQALGVTIGKRTINAIAGPFRDS